jgi:hypothetical protein
VSLLSDAMSPDERDPVSVGRLKVPDPRGNVSLVDNASDPVPVNVPDTLLDGVVSPGVKVTVRILGRVRSVK